MPPKGRKSLRGKKKTEANKMEDATAVINSGETSEGTQSEVEEPSSVMAEEPTSGTAEEPTSETAEEPTSVTVEEPTPVMVEEPTFATASQVIEEKEDAAIDENEKMDIEQALAEGDGGDTKTEGMEEAAENEEAIITNVESSENVVSAEGNEGIAEVEGEKPSIGEEVDSGMDTTTKGDEAASFVNAMETDHSPEPPSNAEEKDQDATIKTEDGDDMVIMENDEELIADDVESIKVEEKKKVPEIYSEDLPAKTDGAKRKQPGKHIEKLLKCKICNSLCTRGVSVACCGTQACRGCATKVITLKKICWGCPLVIKTDNLLNDEPLRTAVKHFKDGEFIPEEIIAKIKDRQKKENKTPKSPPKKAGEFKIVRVADLTACFQSNFPVLYKLEKLSADCKAVKLFKTGLFERNSEPAVVNVLRKGNQAFAFGIFTSASSVPLQQDVVKHFERSDIKVVRANSYANKYTEVAADQAPALPSKMGQLNLILKSKAEIVPGVSSVLVDLDQEVVDIEDEDGSIKTFAQANVFVFSQAEEAPSTIKIVNQVFCVVKDASRSARLVLHNPGTSNVVLEKGQILGHANILHEGNTVTALVQNQVQAKNFASAIDIYKSKGISTNTAATPNENQKKKTNNAEVAPVQGVSVKKSDFSKQNKSIIKQQGGPVKKGGKQGVSVKKADLAKKNKANNAKKLPVTDLRTKLIAKKANQGAAHNGGAQSAKPAAAGQKAAVAGPNATDKKTGHVWVPRGPKRPSTDTPSGASPPKKQNIPNKVSNQTKGSNAGNNRNMAGNNRNMTGNYRNMAGNNRNMAGNNRDRAGNNQNMSGNNRNMADNIRNMAPNNRNFADNSRNMGGVMWARESMDRGTRNGMGGHNSFNNPMVGQLVKTIFNPQRQPNFNGDGNRGYNRDYNRGYNNSSYNDHYDSAEVERRKLESMHLAEERRRLTLEAEERQFEAEKKAKERRLHLAKLDQELMMERKRIKEMKEELERNRMRDEAVGRHEEQSRFNSDFEARPGWRGNRGGESGRGGGFIDGRGRNAMMGSFSRPMLGDGRH